MSQDGLAPFLGYVTQTCLHHRLLFSVALYTTSNHTIIQFSSVISGGEATRCGVARLSSTIFTPSHQLDNATKDKAHNVQPLPTPLELIFYTELGKSDSIVQI